MCIRDRGIDSILLEGGGTLNWEALESGIVQKTEAYIAPKLFGGETSKTPVEGAGFLSPGDGIVLKLSLIHIFILAGDTQIDMVILC